MACSKGRSDHARRAIVKFRLANFLAWGTGDLELAYDACKQAHDLFLQAGDRRQTLLAARELAWIKGLQGDLAGMGADARAVVEAADAVGDRFVAMQGLAAVGYSAMFRGAFAEAETAQRRAAAIAGQDDKAYRLTVVLGGLALGLALQGRVAETAALFDEAKAANPAYRESILVEVETGARWIEADFTAAMALAREAVARQPGATPGGRAIGPVFGALAAIECDDVVEAERLLARAQAAYDGRDWSYFLPATRYAEAVLAWHEGRAAECVAVLRPAVARLLDMQARTWAAFALFDLAEAAADAGDVAAATVAAEDLTAVADVVGGVGGLYWGFAAAGSAWAALAGGDGERAVESARRAIELLSSTGCAAHLARAHDVLGRSLPADDRARSRGRARAGGGDPRAIRERLAQATVARGAASPRQRRAARGGGRARAGFVDAPRARGGPPRRDRHERQGHRPDAVRRGADGREPPRQRLRRNSAWSPSCSSCAAPRSWGSREANPYPDPYPSR